MYGLNVKIGTRPGQREAVAAILRRDVEALAGAGCRLYLVSLPVEGEDAVLVTEVWESPEAHRASLGLPSVQSAIAEARPLLAGSFERVELEVLGGLGLSTGA